MYISNVTRISSVFPKALLNRAHPHAIVIQKFRKLSIEVNFPAFHAVTRCEQLKRVCMYYTQKRSGTKIFAPEPQNNVAHDTPDFRYNASLSLFSPQRRAVYKGGCKTKREREIERGEMIYEDCSRYRGAFRLCVYSLADALLRRSSFSKTLAHAFDARMIFRTMYFIMT